MTSLTRSKTIETDRIYDYVPLPERPRLVWPDDRWVAVVLCLNVEVFDLHRPAVHRPAGLGLALQTSGTYSPGASRAPVRQVPDTRTYAWTDYGLRVGFWRIAELLDDLGIPASCPTNADAATRYPEVVDAMLKRGWEIVGHSSDQVHPLAPLHGDREAERALIADSTERLERACGQRPIGWCSPASSSTMNTPQLLAEAGYRWFGDYANDEQPYLLNTQPHQLVAIPTDHLLTDYRLLYQAPYTSESYLQMVRDHFDLLYREGARTGRVICLRLHPEIIGRPHRIGYLRQLLDHMLRHPRVWITTGAKVAQAYLAQAAAGVEQS